MYGYLVQFIYDNNINIFGAIINGLIYHFRYVIFINITYKIIYLYHWRIINGSIYLYSVRNFYQYYI